MHDTLAVFGRDPIHRRHHHDQLTFRSLYAYAENYCLPLSHDEVVHGKGSLLTRMPGDAWQQAAGLRTLLAYKFTTPGKKLLFMGGEFGQPSEWAHERSLDWHLLDDPRHAGIMASVGDLARCYRDVPALHEGDCEPFGFEWVDGQDAAQSVVSFLRRARDGSCALVVVNLTPVTRGDYRIGVPQLGVWRELFNSDASSYGGSGVGNLGAVTAEDVPFHDRPHSIVLTLPPLAVLILAPAADGGR
jgi:1,4-alpha-glucan branching enzyme